MSDIFLTGVTGLVGRAVAKRLLRANRRRTVYALLRNPAQWPALSAAPGSDAARIVPVRGDLCSTHLGLDARMRRALATRVRHVIHCAADTTFSRPLAEARAINTRGTAHLLQLAADWQVDRLTHVSTAFVAGARTGRVEECELDSTAGFINGYEQSKYEAEQLVRSSALPWVILRSSTIVCDDDSGAVTQLNVVHRALRVFYNGLAAMMPGTEDTPVDLVTTDYVAAGIADIGTGQGMVGHTYHLCAGAAALPLGQLLDDAYATWSRDPAWRRRGIARPALTSLETYRLFEDSVEETGDVRLTSITRSLSHFVPQLALPKEFVTSAADAALGYSAAPVATFWPRVVEQLVSSRWCAGQRRAA